MTRTEIGMLLARARMQAAMTQSRLAEAMGTTQPVVARAEGGYRLPTIDFIDRWARATGAPLTITFGGSGEADASPARKRALIDSVLGPGRFDPWERDPSSVEAALLERAGRTPAYFSRLKASRGKERRPKAR
ncbi:MAG: helix-turn-helix transcriptional regulator [Chloroflexi bacterium]|nr:MAG: helix-turn-helix transcriptional regulator [Chloroflexota bacterium]